MDAELAQVRAAALAGDAATLKAIIGRGTEQETAAFQWKPVLAAIGAEIDRDDLPLSPVAAAALTIDVGTHGIECMRRNINFWEEVDFKFRTALFRVYVGADDNLRAATLLSQAHLESTSISDAERAVAYVRCAQNFLKADDTVNAERYFRKANGVVFTVEDVDGLRLQFRTLNAQLNDQNRKFADAAGKYLDVLRQVNPEDVDVQEISFLLAAASKCVILAPAGRQRMAVMHAILTHYAADTIPFPIATLLGRLHAKKVITPEQAADFEATLLPHQRTTSADGLSILARSLAEHNLFVASERYDNIRLSRLAAFCGLTPAMTERMLGSMISEGRLNGSIDQVDGFVEFTHDTAAGASGASAAAGASDAAWQASVRDACSALLAASQAVDKEVLAASSASVMVTDA